MLEHLEGEWRCVPTHRGIGGRWLGVVVDGNMENLIVDHVDLRIAERIVREHNTHRELVDSMDDYIICLQETGVHSSYITKAKRLVKRARGEDVEE